MRMAAVCFSFVDHFNRKNIPSKTATQHSSNLAFVIDSGNLHSSSRSIVQLVYSSLIPAEDEFSSRVTTDLTSYKKAFFVASNSTGLNRLLDVVAILRNKLHSPKKMVSPLPRQLYVASKFSKSARIC